MIVIKGEFRFEVIKVVEEGLGVNARRRVVWGWLWYEKEGRVGLVNGVGFVGRDPEELEEEGGEGEFSGNGL